MHDAYRTSSAGFLYPIFTNVEIPDAADAPEPEASIPLVDFPEPEAALFFEEESPDSETPPLVHWLLGQMGKFPLLSLEEEIDLSQRAGRGREAAIRLSQALDLPVQTLVVWARKRLMEEKDPLLEAQIAGLEPPLKRERLYLIDGEKATLSLVEHNLRLVVHIAKRYARHTSRMGIEDLIQEGTLGLLQAAERYDWRKRCKFSTYAYWWIRQAITRGMAERDGLVSLPAEQFGRIGKNPELTSHVMGVRCPASLDGTLAQTVDIDLGDTLYDPKVLVETVEEKLLSQEVTKTLQTLPPLERQALARWNQMACEGQVSYSQLAQELGVSSKEARNLVERGKKRFRLYARKNNLEDALR